MHLVSLTEAGVYNHALDLIDRSRNVNHALDLIDKRGSAQYKCSSSLSLCGAEQHGFA